MFAVLQLSSNTRTSAGVLLITILAVEYGRARRCSASSAVGSRQRSSSEPVRAPATRTPAYSIPRARVLARPGAAGRTPRVRSRPEC